MAIAARRLGLDHAALARRNLLVPAEMPYRTPSGALYDSGDYEACLDQALELAEYEAIRERAATARAEGRLAGVGIACVVEPSISNMGYITLAQTAVERTATLPKSGNAEARPSRSIRSEASRCGSERPPGTGSPDGLRAGGCRRARMRTGRRDGAVRARHRDDAVDRRVGQLLVALPGSGSAQSRRPRDGSARRSTRSASTSASPSSAAQGGRDGPLEPRGPARGDGARTGGGRLLGGTEPRSAGWRGSRRLVGRPRLHRRRLRRRDRSRDRRRA